MSSETKTPRMPRVRESCKPCRQRKTRCNAQISCVLRGTENECEFRQAPHAAPAYPDPYAPYATNADMPQMGGMQNQHLLQLQNAVSAATAGSGGGGGASSASSYGFGGGMQLQSVPHAAAAAQASQPHTPQATLPRGGAGGAAEAQRLKSTIARLQNDLDAINKREDTEQNRALWRGLMEILPPKRVCETLLEYVLQECDWQWHTSNIAPLWARCIALQSCTPGQCMTLCVSLALPIFVLRHQSHPLYPVPPLSYGSEEAFYHLAASLATEVKDLEDINAICDFCTYLIYTQALHELPRYITRCEEVALEKGYLDESSDGWTGVEGGEREWRRQVVFKLVSMSRWKQMYTCHDNFAHVQMNVCRPDLRPISLSAPIDLALPLEGGTSWPDRATYRAPLPTTNASEFRVLRIKPAVEQERTARFQQFLTEALDIVPAITRVQNASQSESRAELAYSVYQQLLRIRDVRKNELGLPDELLETLDTNEDVQRRLALQVLVARSGVSHIIGYLLRPWLLSASTSSLSPESGYPTLHARLATAALDNAEYSMKSIPLVQAMLPYPQANMIGAFTSANLFNAATAFAVPVLRAVQAWRGLNTGDGESDAQVRQLPAWPASFFPHHFGRSEGSAHNLPKDDSATQSRGHGGSSHPNSPGFLDGIVRTYANWILLILDSLTLLKHNYLGKEAEARLRALVETHNIRDGTGIGNAQSSSSINMGLNNLAAAAHPPIAPDLLYEGTALAQASAPSYAPRASNAGETDDERDGGEMHLGPMGVMGGGGGGGGAGDNGTYGETGALSNGYGSGSGFGSGAGASDGRGVTMMTVADAEAATARSGGAGPEGSAGAAGQQGQGSAQGQAQGQGAMGMGMDLRWLDELLSMDQSVWDGLLKDGSREIGM